MPRKKKPAAAVAATAIGVADAGATTMTMEAAAAPAEPEQAEPLPSPIELPAAVDGPAHAQAWRSPQVDQDGRDEPPRNWGDPYKSIFNCPEQGFELGEHRRFKQRVFRFADRPSDEVIAELKDRGFTYRAAEKAWTVPADPASRKLTDEMARRWAGPNYVQGLER